MAVQAFAQDWSAFDEAFPLFPCQDGWMACEVSGERLSPEFVRDEGGRVMPSDARLGWFDLSPSAGFSPFVELSQYPAPPPGPPPRSGRSKTGSSVQPRTPKIPPNMPLSTSPPVEEEEVPADCRDLLALEPTALLGKLSPEVERCLEARLPQEKQTEKRRISALLMVDAWMDSDHQRWEKLVTRHLDEIDQSDPDLCYKYALFLSRQGSSRSEGVLRWSGVALENRTVWSGDVYKGRVYSLYKVRAAAAQTLWSEAEAAHARAPSDQSREQTDRLRSLTKVTAREWYEYASSAGKPTEVALELCRSAAGTSEYCE